jgi:hypothetical protein
MGEDNLVCNTYNYFVVKRNEQDIGTNLNKLMDSDVVKNEVRCANPIFGPSEFEPYSLHMEDIAEHCILPVRS